MQRFPLTKGHETSLLTGEELAASKHFGFDFLRLFAPSEPIHSANIVHSYLFANFQQKTLICKREDLGCDIWLSINENIQSYPVYCLSIHF